MRFNALMALGTLTMAAPSLAAQTIIKDNSSPVSVTSITDFSTEFNKVGGMNVTWTLSPSGGSSAIWADISVASGISGAWGIWTNNLKIWGNGGTDTFGDNVWNFWGKNITSVTMDALLGNGVFDVLDCSDSGCSTENSSSGKQFDWSGTGPSSRVTYSRPVQLGANVFVGDLYGTLMLEFGSYTESCAAGYSSSNGECKKWTGAYQCDAGYSIYHTNECKELIPTQCTSSGYDYNPQSHKCEKSRRDPMDPTYDIINADKVYDYQPSIKTWNASSFSSTCTNNPDDCERDFSQDMDNYNRDQPGTGQEVVPEPATMTLLATGLAGMAAARRRKNAAK